MEKAASWQAGRQAALAATASWAAPGTERGASSQGYLSADIINSKTAVHSSSSASGCSLGRPACCRPRLPPTLLRLQLVILAALSALGARQPSIGCMTPLPGVLA